MNCHIIMDAYMAAYMDDDMEDDVGDDITIPAHLLTAQHQRWAIFSLFSTHFQYVFSPFEIYFQPIHILVSAHFSIYLKIFCHMWQNFGH